MAEPLRRGVLEPSMVYAFLMTKGEQQVPQAKSKGKARARSRVMTNEGAEEAPGVSPWSTAREAAHGVREGRNDGTLDCSPKGAARMTIFSPTSTQLHVFFFGMVQRDFAWPLCKDDTHIWKSSMAPVHR